VAEESTPPEQRVTISLSTLRAELSGLELRLVDRLNGALANKADRTVQEQLSTQLSDARSRISLLEANTVKREGPVVHMVEDHTKQLTNLQAIAGYKKWLWAQTVALAGIAIAIIGVLAKDGSLA
jgi:hypothetical protein